LNWYKNDVEGMSIMFTLPSEFTKVSNTSENDIILDVFEKNENVNAKKYLQEIIDNADKYGVTIYVHPIPRTHKLKSEEHKSKITKDYLISYYKNFDFVLDADGFFMVRKAKENYKEGGLIAPNGKKSNLTPEQYKLVRTPAFKKWFGDWENDPENASKILNENGEPLVCFHGSNQTLNIFNEKYIGSANDEGFYGRGFYFTFQTQTKYFKAAFDEAGYYGDKIIGCFIKSINPFNIEILSKYKGYDINYIGIENIVFLSNLAIMYPKLTKDIKIEKHTWDSIKNETYFTEISISILPTLIEKYRKLLKTYITDNNWGERNVKSGYVKSEIVEFINSRGEKQTYDSFDSLGRWEFRIDKGVQYPSNEEIEIGLICEAIEKYDGIKAKYNPEGYMTRYPEITDAIRQKHDSILQNESGDELVVFEPNQIKLADGSNKTFDSNNPDIRYSSGGRISSSRLGIPNVRGSWTKEKILKYLKSNSSDTITTYTLAKFISEFDSWQELKDRLYYHGTSNSIPKGLKPSIVFSERLAEQQGGGGYGERYWGISLTKRKRTAESFSGMSSYVTVYPVFLKKDAKIIERLDLNDASDIEDIIIELYEKGIDAVYIGGGEEELVVVNPYSIMIYKDGSENFDVYGGFKTNQLTDEQIKEIYDKYKLEWENYYKEYNKTDTRKEFLNSLKPIKFEKGGTDETNLDVRFDEGGEITDSKEGEELTKDDLIKINELDLSVIAELIQNPIVDKFDEDTISNIQSLRHSIHSTNEKDIFYGNTNFDDEIEEIADDIEKLNIIGNEEQIAKKIRNFSNKEGGNRKFEGGHEYEDMEREDYYEKAYSEISEEKEAINKLVENYLEQLDEVWDNYNLDDVSEIRRKKTFKPSGYLRNRDILGTGVMNNSKSEKFDNKINDIIVEIYNKSKKDKSNSELVKTIDSLIKESNFKKGGLIAPNGKKSNLTPEQYELVRTPAFKEFFGDWENEPLRASKVVDENGEPKVVYHGTYVETEFNIFDFYKADLGFHFGTYQQAKNRSETKMGKEGYKSIVLPYFLNSRILFEINDVGEFENPQSYLADLLENNIISGVEFEENNFENLYYKEENKIIRDFLIEKFKTKIGFIYDNKVEADGKSYIVLQPNQIKLADGTNTTFYRTNPDVRFDEGGEVDGYTETLKASNITESEREEWRDKNKVNQKQKRIPEVKDAAILLKSGDISQNEYLETVRKYQPIKPFTKVPEIPSLKDIIFSLNKDKVARGILGVNYSIKDGTMVATRLDIPAYEDYDTWVVSVHDANKEGLAMTYGQTAVLKNVQFKTFPSTALNIAIDKSKSTIGRMFGEWVNESPKDVRNRAIEVIDDKKWIQVGMNPFRHSWFYDKKDGLPILSADEVIQVGALVLAKNAVKTTPDNPIFIADKKSGVRFDGGGKLKATGDCYYAAGQLAMLNENIDYIGTPYLVHAEVKGQGKIKGISYGHAWIEDDENVYDFSNGKRNIIPKDFYYLLGGVKTNNPQKYRKYTFSEATQKMLDTGNYGCWDLDVEYLEGGNLGEEINCRNCGWHWNTNQSEDFDKYVCHKCGFDNALFYENTIMDKGGKISKPAWTLVGIYSDKDNNSRTESEDLTKDGLIGYRIRFNKEPQYGFGYNRYSPEELELAQKTVKERNINAEEEKALKKIRDAENKIKREQQNKENEIKLQLAEQEIVNKPAYLMEESEYQDKVVPILKEYEKFVRKNEQYLTTIEYDSFIYLTFEQILERNLEGKSVGYNYRLVDDNDDDKLTQEQKTIKNWNYRKLRNYELEDAPEPTPIDVLEKNQEFLNKLSNYFSDDTLYNGLNKSISKSNKWNVKLAIEDNTYKNLLEDGELSENELEKIANSVDVKVPKKVFSKENVKSKETQALLQKLLIDIPKINIDKLQELVESIKIDFKPIEEETFIKEKARYQTYIKNTLSEEKVYETDLIYNLPIWNEIFNFKNKLFEKINTGTYERGYRGEIGKEIIEQKIYYVGLSLKTDFESKLDKFIKEYVETLKYSFIRAIIKNFTRITKTIVSIEKIEIELGYKGFEGVYRFKFEDGSYFDFKAEAIPAGGYNIQAYHFRYITNFENITLADGSKVKGYYSVVENFSLKKMDKGGQINYNDIKNNNYMKNGGELNPDNKEIKEYYSHKSGNAGGMLVGNRHSEGGIKAINKSSNSPIEMEGGEVVITRNAVSDNTKREFNGEMLTNKQILSKINQSGGGVSFEDGGELPENIMVSGKEYSYGGKVMKDHEIVSSCGCKHSMAEGGEVNDRQAYYATLSNKSYEDGGELDTDDFNDTEKNVLIHLNRSNHGLIKIDRADCKKIKDLQRKGIVYVTQSDSHDCRDVKLTDYGIEVVRKMGNIQFKKGGEVGCIECGCKGYKEGGITVKNTKYYQGTKFEYKNQFQINKAIEELITDIEPQDLTPEEKQFSSYYSGYGGLEKFGASGKGLLYEYFTPSEIAKKMWGLAYKYGFKGGLVLEPSCGIGEFIKYAPEESNVTGYEINEFSAKICKILYPMANIESKYFETLFIKNNSSIKDKTVGMDKYSLIIGNPPYGSMGGIYAGLGEKSYTKANNYIDYFIFRGLDLLQTDGLLIYIIGTEVAAGGVPFLQQQMNTFKENITKKADIVDAYRLPNGLFETTDVLTDIIVFKKR
jgi:hypothetical protein